MDRLALVVLAAGIGSRYGGVKQMEPVGPSGEIIIDYSVYDALRAGFDKVVFVVSQEIADAFRDRVGRKVEERCETAYVIQRLDDLPPGFAIPAGREKPWGTGHATLVCRPEITAPFAVINADDFYGRSSYQVLAEHLRGARDKDGAYDYSMVGYQIENTLTEHGHVSRGICETSAQGTLVQIQERLRVEKTASGARYLEGEQWFSIPPRAVVSMNMWGFTPSFMRELESRFPRFLAADHADPLKSEFLLPRIVNDIVEEGRARVSVLPTIEQWFGVTYREDRLSVLKAIERLVAEGIYPADLWAGG